MSSQTSNRRFRLEFELDAKIKDLSLTSRQASNSTFKTWLDFFKSSSWYFSSSWLVAINLNKHEIILNMIYDKLIFKSFKCNHHDNIFNQAMQTRRLKTLKSNRRSNVFNWRRDTILSQKDNVEHIATMSFRYIILSRLKIKSLSFTVENELNAFDSKCFECSTHSKVDHDNESFVIESNHSEIDISTITKATFVKKRDLKRQRNKRWKIRKQQSEFFSLSRLNSNDSMNIAIIDAIFFCLLIDVKNRKQKV